MTITALGTLTIGGTVPGAAAAVTAGLAGINGALPDITARLVALQQFAPQPVSFTAQLALAQGTLASVQAAITLGLPVPDISAQIAIVLAQIAALEAMVAAINVNYSVVLSMSQTLAVGSVSIYKYSGVTSALGTELATATSAGLPGGTGSTNCNAIVLATIDAATWTSMQLVFKTS